MKTPITFFLTILLIFSLSNLRSQNTFPTTGAAGIGTTAPAASSLLEVKSTSKGVLFPRMTKTQRDNIPSPATGLLIYQTNSTPGLYYYSGSAWTPVTTKSKGWNLTGNSATDPATNFLGTTDLKPLVIKVNNEDAGYIGAGTNSTTSWGYQSANANPSGPDITAIGSQALFSNTSGGYNTAVGANALYYNTTGELNTAVGYQALLDNASGKQNTACGGDALANTTIGSGNTAVGSNALQLNTEGNNNFAGGYFASYTNKTGIQNVAVGYNTLYTNSDGSNNTAVGYAALYSNTGTINTALGYQSLFNNATGIDNTACGPLALFTNTTGSNNTALGYNADVTSGSLSNATVIGYNASGTASNQVRVGNNTVSSIGGYANWSNISDGRFKKNIQENVPGLSFINKLKPVTYNLDIKGIDDFLHPSSPGKATAEDNDAINAKEAIVYSGFVAQEVEKAASESDYDFSGVDAPKNEKDLYGLRYAEFVVPLVKAVQELSQKNEQLRANNEKLTSQVEHLAAVVNNLQLEISDFQKTQGSNIGNTSVSVGLSRLDQNVPNPSDGSTVIQYYIAQNEGDMRISFYNESGVEIKSVKVSSRGEGQILLEAGEFSPGSYHYSLLKNGIVLDSKKMIIIK